MKKKTVPDMGKKWLEKKNFFSSFEKKTESKKFLDF
jgi:hypothetical protein